MKMSQLKHLVLLTCLVINLGRAERIPENPIPFRDRSGNRVELANYAATYKAAGSRHSVPILTKVGHDISKMETDFQRSYVLLFSGQFKGKIGTPPGNLYIFYTDRVKYCNNTAVAYEIFSDMNLSDFTNDRRSNDLELSFGHIGRMIFSRGLLTNIMRNININEYYEKLYCRENRNNKLIYLNCQSDTTDSENSANEIIEDIMDKYEDSLRNRFIKKNEYINILERSLRNSNNLIRSCQQVNREMPKKPNDLDQDSDEFRNYLINKLNRMSNLKENSKTDEEISISKALEWQQKSIKCQRNIDRLQNQLNVFRRAFTSRFSDGDETCTTLDPFNATLNSGHTNYTCIPNDKIIDCIDYWKADTSTKIESRFESD